MKFLFALVVLGLCAAAYADGDCPVEACTLQYAPVCAVNNKGESKTFSNPCELKATQKCLDKDAGWRQTKPVACDQPNK